MIDEFITYLEDEIKRAETTVRGYRYDLKHLEGFLTKRGTTLLNTTREDASQYLRHLNSKLLPTSVHRKIAAAKAFYNYLLDKEIVASNPFVRLKLPKIPETLPKVISVEQYEELLHFPIGSPGDDSYLLELRDRAILETLYSTGVRVSELAALNVSDIDMHNLTIWVQHGKGDKERIVPFGEQCKSILTKYLEVAHPRLAKHLNPLFINKRGTRLSANWIEQMLRKRSEMVLGFPISPHWLRHSCLSTMRENGADMETLADHAGHSSSDITRRIYAKATTKILRRTYDETHPRARKGQSKTSHLRVIA